jgi:hypothetical protein
MVGASEAHQSCAILDSESLRQLESDGRGGVEGRAESNNFELSEGKQECGGAVMRP